MRPFTSFLVFMVLTGCSSHVMRKPSLAVVDVATEKGCNRPSVRLDAINRLDVPSPVKLRDKFSTVALDPGKYAISIACQNPLGEAKDQCVWLGRPNEYPTYKMQLEPGVRYTFHCSEQDRQLIYHVSKSEL